MRTLDDLLSADSAWPLVLEWQREAKNPIELLAVERSRAEASLVAMQVTTRSPMGAVVWESGGILVDRGWVRVLGAGCARLDGYLARWNGLGGAPLRDPLPGALLVAHDAIGGVFAINGGAFGAGNHDVFYFAPDALQWESLERGYSDFLRFLFVGDLERFYEGARWKDWERDVASLPADEGFSIYPLPWTVEGKAIELASRTPVPMTELVRFHFEMGEQLAQR
jgi:hypothetical protein